MRSAIPTGFFGKLFPRSGFLKEHFVTIDAGVIDANFRGIIQALVLNHHPEKTFTIREEDRIAQVAFLEKFNVNYVRVFDKPLLDITKRGNDGFGSTGLSVIKKVKNDSESDQTTESENSCKMLQIVCEKSNDDLQIRSEEAILAVNNDVVVHESITIDE